MQSHNITLSNFFELFDQHIHEVTAFNTVAIEALAVISAFGIPEKPVTVSAKFDVLGCAVSFSTYHKLLVLLKELNSQSKAHLEKLIGCFGVLNALMEFIDGGEKV